MAHIVDPYNFTNGEAADAEQVDARFAAVLAQVNGGLDRDNLSAALQAMIMSPGDIKATARATAPSGWLMCDGAAVSRATYADLFAVIGTTYGTGDNLTTFNLPDLRGRVPVGVDGAAGRLSANDALGNAGGAETVALSDQHLPATNLPQPASQLGGSGGTGSVKGWVYGLFSFLSNDGPATSRGGGGQAHPNLQPYQVVNFVIKT